MKYQYFSSWIQDFYNELSFDLRKGFLVEFGVGNVIDYPGRDDLQRAGKVPDLDQIYSRLPSNTAELLDLGWHGVYVDPVKEYLDQAKLLHKNNLSRLKLLNCGVSDKEEILFIGDNECLISNKFELTEACYYKRKIHCFPAEKILEDHCVNKIDLMSVDVEGMEDRVLRSINYDRFSINLLVVEINKVSCSIISTILPDRYKLAQTDGLNAVYLNKEWK